jgi:hypothetical protein
MDLMGYFLIYIVVSLISLVGLVFMDSHMVTDPLFSKGWIFFLILICTAWPMIFLGCLVLYIWESYRVSVTRKAANIIYKYKIKDFKEIHALSAKELKYLLFAKRIGALDIDNTKAILVQKEIENRYFEKHFLGK